MPRALVTGATGLVGSHVCDRLRADGWSVRALVRAPAPWLAHRGVELAAGDVLDAARVREAARGCDAVVHAAALITPRGGWETFRATNVDGTRAVIEAAAAAGARLLHVSSVAVYGPNARYGDQLTHEDVPLAPLEPHHWYPRSKRDAEQAVLAAHERGEVWATAIRPVVVYGPRDRQFVPRVARLLRLPLLPVPGRGEGVLAIVHAANVADAAFLALTSEPAGGRVYNVANEGEVTLAEFLRLAARGAGRHIRVVPTPLPLVRGGIGAAGVALRIAGAHGLAAMIHSSIGFVTRGNPFTSDRARNELGWRPRVAPTQGIPDAFRAHRAAQAD